MSKNIALTGSEIVRINDVFVKLSMIELPFDLSMMVVKNSLVIQEQHQIILFARSRIIEVDFPHVAGDDMKPENPSWNDFVTKFSEYLQKKVDVTVETVNPYLFDDFRISPYNLSGLTFFFETK